jgi:LCP family protein required for cell wall assembly
MFPERNTEETFFQYDGKEYVLNEDVDTLLVLGLDKFESGNSTIAYNNDKAADFLMLFVFDNAKKTCSAIQINRDTMADVHLLGVDGSRIDTVTKQIALSHTYGNGREVSCRNTAEAVSSVLFDVPVKHYVSMTMDAVPLLNDAVGGVTVTVTDDFSEITSELPMGEVTLYGDQAEIFVRGRKDVGNQQNISRMERQKVYLESFLESLRGTLDGSPTFALSLYETVSPYMVTDCSATVFSEVLSRYSDYTLTEILSPEGESVRGEKYMEFYVDEEKLEDLTLKLFYAPKK